MILRFFKLSFFLTSFLFLTGFVPLPAVLGPAITVATSGNLVKATAQTKTTSIKPSGTKVLDKRGENKVNRVQFMTQLGIAKPSSVKRKPLDTAPASETISVAPKELTSVAPKKTTIHNIIIFLIPNA